MSDVKIKKGQGNLQYIAEVGRHVLIADTDAAHGGEDTGPNPHDFLGISLGACTAITTQMYANRKGWNLKGAEVVVTQEKDGETNILNRKIKFAGELSDEQRERLLEIADKCPIHKLLSGKIVIKTVVIA